MIWDDTRTMQCQVLSDPAERPAVRMRSMVDGHVYVIEWFADPHGLLDYGRQLRRWEAAPELNFGPIDRIYWSAWGIALVRRIREMAEAEKEQSR